MKTIKLLFSISLIFVFAKFANAQVSINNNTRFFYVHYVNQAPPNDRFATLDTVEVKYRNIDTIVFSQKGSYTLNGKMNFLSVSNKTYGLQNQDTFLLYDYNKVKGDTFTLKYNSQSDLFLIDSVIGKKLDDLKTYRHWFLTSTDKRYKLVWVENFGEQTRGWNYTKYKLADYSGSIKAICTADTMVFWNKTFDGFEPRRVMPGCDFGSYFKMVSVTEIKEKSIKVFPNPIENTLNIEADQAIDFIELTDLAGKTMIQSNDLKINIEHLNNGVYLLNIHFNSGQRFVKKVIKNNF